jgi:hypothetical protein
MAVSTAPSSGTRAKPPSEINPSRPAPRLVANLVAASPGKFSTSWLEYAIDSFHRSVLLLDLLRKRGNEQAEITSRPMATVLRFDHEVIMSGRSLPRPINYYLSRIVPPPGMPTDQRKRPVVVVDPRAGQGPGVGGFKAQSEIGDALAAGHPVYFIGFSARPEPGQQFLDIVEGQVKFFERVAELYPDGLGPFAIGNCQSNSDGRDSAAGPLRAVPGCGFTDVVLARRARKEPDALHRRPARR